jgi:hypothetical protein
MGAMFEHSPTGITEMTHPNWKSLADLEAFSNDE